MPEYFADDRPDMKESPLAWEASWECDFKRVYSSRAWSRGSLSDICASKNMVLLFASDSAILHVTRNRPLVIALQSRLTQRVSKACAQERFEERWRSMPSAKRNSTILQGICRVMSVPDADVDRPWCPDSTLRHLCSNNGETFLSMMKQLLSPVESALNQNNGEPSCVPHPIVDRLLALTEAEKSMPGFCTFAAHMKIARARLLTEIIFATICAFYGETFEGRAHFTYTGKKTQDMTAGIPTDLHESVRETVEKLLAQPGRSMTGEAYACWACGKYAIVGQKMQVCARCRTIGRKFTYCSRECQVKDWKSGTHKTICGKPLTEEDLASLRIGPGAVSPPPSGTDRQH